MSQSQLSQPLSLRHGLNDWLVARPSLRSGTFGLIACVCIALFGVEGWQLWRVYETNIMQSDAVSSNTARLLAEEAETTLQTADTVVASLVAQVEAEGTGPEALMRFHRLMTSLAEALPAIHEMGIVDSRGNAIAKSLVADPHGLNYADREYFHYHATHTDRGPFIGARIASKVDGNYSITVTRRINHPDGSFGGLAVTSVSLKFFQLLFDQMQLESGGVISLLTDDDRVLVRSPANRKLGDDRVGQSPLRQQMHDHPTAGSASYVSTTDGVQRRGSYQHLNRFPVSTLVSQSDWDLQKSWRAEMRSHAAILGCVMIVLVVLGGRAVQATRMLAAQAMQDGLTGLANRRCFDETIEREVRRATRSGQPVSLVLIDLDHFKAYNDCYGHPAGDACLRAVADTIKRCLRRGGDLAARYGGEEIAVILPGSAAATALILAETMRLAIRNLGIRQAHQLGGIVTLSAGVATCGSGLGRCGPASLIEDADAALYVAKAGGRDAVRANVQSEPVAMAI